MSGPPPLRVGMLGAGMVSEHHLAAWARVEGAAVVAIADRDSEKAARRAARFGIPRTYGSAAALLEAERLDAVDIVTPVETHADLCRAAAGRGLAIQCQKPLCPTHAEAAGLVADIGPKVRFMVHENWRYRPVYRRLGRILDGGALGPLRRVELEVASGGLLADAQGRLPALERQPFLARLDRLIVGELLIHHLDVLAWLFGPLQPLSAKLSRRSGAVAGEDTAEIVLRTAAGRPVGLRGTFCDPGAPTPRDAFVVEGERGRVTFDGETLRGEGAPEACERFDPAESYAASYAGAVAAFVGGLRAGTPFETEAASNIATLALIERIYALGGAVVDARDAPAPGIHPRIER